MNNIFKSFFLMLFVGFLFTACSSKKEEKTIHFEKQQYNSKEALKEL